MLSATALLTRDKGSDEYGFQMRLIESVGHVIYQIDKNTPADLCCEIQVGDVITHINGSTVHGLLSIEVERRIARAARLELVLVKDHNVRNLVYRLIRQSTPDRELPDHPWQPAEEIETVLNRKDDYHGWGFILGSSNILELFVNVVLNDSPASGKVEVGDLLMAVNQTDVQKMSSMEVSKLLGRLSAPLTLKLKRDPRLKNYVQENFPTVIDESTGQPKLMPIKIPLIGTKYSFFSPPENPGENKQSDASECQSESTVRIPSRIPQAISQQSSRSAPQSPSHARNPVRASQIPKPKADMVASRFVITGQSQFQQSREVEKPNSKDMQKGASLVHYGKLSSSTSHSDDSSSSGLPEDCSNANGATEPSALPTIARQNIGPAVDNLGGSNTGPVHVANEGQESEAKCIRADDADEKHQMKKSCDTESIYAHTLLATNADGSDNPLPAQASFSGCWKKKPHDQSYSVPTSPLTSTVAAGGVSAGNDPKGSSGIISLPTSPESALPYGIGANSKGKGVSRSVVTRVDCSTMGMGSNASSGELSDSLAGPPVRKCDAAGFRTSRSEDHLQQGQRDGGLGAIVPIDIDEDVYSSLNTLLDTEPDSKERPKSPPERFLWTYNMYSPQKPNATARQASGRVRTKPTQLSLSSSISSSLQRSVSESPASPTSVSSSVMSSSDGSREHSHTGHGGVTGGRTGSVATVSVHSNADTGASAHSNNEPDGHKQQQPPHAGKVATPHSYGQGVCDGAMQSTTGGDHSVSEAVSNLSSPDYQDEHDLFSSKDLMAMAISDHSDSDSTILVSETTHRFELPLGGAAGADSGTEHTLIIELKPDEAPEADQQESDDLAAELQQQQPPQQNLPQQQQAPSQVKRDSSPPISDDGSDVESLHSYHYSVKAVDRPSAERLARRLFYQDGFNKMDICRHLSKNNEFTRVLGDEYLSYYDFTNMTLDVALRAFVKTVPLFGETQERERVMFHFAKRYMDNNPGVFKSVGATHFLVSALLILNSDIHGEVQFHRTFSTFTKRLKFGNDGEHFPKELLKQLFSSIKDHRLEPAIDDDSKRSSVNSGECAEGNAAGEHGGSLQGPPVGPNPFLEAPRVIAAVEFKKGYVVRKSCYETNHKRTPFGRRSWKMLHCTLRDLVLYLHNDEHGFRRNQVSDNLYNGIRIHHALASRATDYNKRHHVFRLQTADQSEFLFQTSDSNELQSWIDTINYVCATFSAPPLEGAVGSQKRFQRPLLPCSSTKLSMREQLASHETQYENLCRMLDEHKENGQPSKGLSLQNYKEKDYYLQYELKRYKTYCHLLNSRLTLEPQDFGNQHAVSEAALKETSMDVDNGDDDGHDDEADDDVLCEPVRNVSGTLSHLRLQGSVPKTRTGTL